MTKHRYFFSISFNGSNYHGWQIQPDAITVQQVMNEHIGVMIGEKVNCVGCGRTDAGVHAKNYLFHVDIKKELTATFARKLDAFLPKDIKINRIYANPKKIHARWDARFRSYEYIVSKGKDPFRIELVTNTFEKFNLERMNQACEILMEYDDFETFSKSHNSQNHYFCELIHASWSETDEHYLFSIKANRFVRSMVRMIVGTMLDVGRGRVSLDGFRKIIESKDRKNAGKTVPAGGLYFTGVGFPEDVLIELS
ncbi:tRNA pseudouridine(38-40) synthase TruA [Bacteroidota bacterium]